ncbi:Uncharacterised protein [Enterobacter hormaechei]|nr:Uncharacterised protein [Enterobacter hormaechei]
MNRIGKALRQRQIRRGGFTPDQVGVRGIRQAAADRLFNTGMCAIEPFAGTFAGNEFAVIRVAVRGDQVRRVRIGTGNHQRRHAEHVSSQTRGNQLLDRFLGWHQHFPAHMPALLHRRQLIFKVNGRCTGLNHGFHQLKGVQHAAETGFRIGDDRQEIVDKTRIVGFDTRGPLDLIRTAEGIVDPIHH